MTASTARRAAPPACASPDAASPGVVRKTLHSQLAASTVFHLLLADESHCFWLRRAGLEVMGAADAGPGSIARDPWSEISAPAPHGQLDPRGDANTRPVPGWFGWLSYEDGTRRLIPTTSPGEGPTSAMMRCSRLIVVDEPNELIELLWTGDDAGAAAWADQTASTLEAARAAPPRAAPSGISNSPVPQPRWRHGDQSYLELIKRCLEAIYRGDAYQLCLTNQATIAARVDPLRLHAELRALNPAPESALIRIGDTALVSSSPERFLTISQSGTVATHPIKGTRPRGHNAGADRAIADELRLDPKERAENVMIVDLMRNDLSRVTRLGSISVTRLFEVERHPHVHQLVSSVEGRLGEAVTPIDVVDACFPAGSMTGAPKVAAVQLLGELEAGRRGIYSGCYGSIGFDGTAHLSMAIRTAVVTADSVTIGAGGGITAASDPARELAEVKLKASAIIEATRRAVV